AGLVSPSTCRASDPVPAARDRFQEQTSCPAGGDNREVVAASEVVVLAVKPQSMAALLDEIRHAVTERHLIVSIAAGVTLKQLADGLLANYRMVRVMPNTPCLVGASAAGFAAGPGAKAGDT